MTLVSDCQASQQNPAIIVSKSGSADHVSALLHREEAALGTLDLSYKEASFSQG